MSKKRINKRTFERCLLTDIAPYETPILFSNWGSYKYEKVIRNDHHPKLLKKIFGEVRYSIPYTFRIKKDSLDFRHLHLIHPGHSKAIVDFYRSFDVMIVKLCNKSVFSIRAPHEIAKYFNQGKGESIDTKYVEALDESKAYASSYFKYRWYAYLYRYFESPIFSKLEKRFSKLQYLDISNCFLSIYTHSISWAIQGKHFAKENRNNDTSFGTRFDGLINSFNHKETNGIVVGPELSRIFSEVILQSVDHAVKSRMDALQLVFGEDYFCNRYIDDYFVFYNSDITRNRFITILQEELDKYRLRVNHAKSEVDTRPFITDISTKKIQLKEYVFELDKKIKEKEKIDSGIELNRVKAIVKNTRKLNSLTNVYLSSLINRFRFLSFEKNERAEEYALLYIDLIFHWFRMDIRVSSAYKVTKFVTDCLTKLKKAAIPTKRKIEDKLHFEIVDALKSSVHEGSVLEAMNLIIAASELGNDYSIPKSEILRIIDKCKVDHGYPNWSRISYFEIVTLIYYFKDRPEFSDLKASLVQESVQIIERQTILEYSESAFLFLDLLSCPFLEDNQKDSLIIAAKKSDPGSTEPEAYIRRFCSNQTWYFNWNKNNSLKSLLKKKDLLVSY
jgi:hypothetical protein